MKAALIARGIGHELAAAHRCDIAIGINHAAAMYPCDWWCFCDMEVARDMTPMGAPQWFTTARTIRRLAHRGIAAPADALPWDSLGRPGRWPVFSSTAGLMLAAHLGATSIIGIGLYTMNFPRPVAGEAARWVAERDIWNETVDRLGVPVTGLP